VPGSFLDGCHVDGCHVRNAPSCLDGIPDTADDCPGTAPGATVVTLNTLLASFVAPGGWVLMLLAIAFYALFWRVDNEPGARPVPGLL
jgi:hypothetical protein